MKPQLTVEELKQKREDSDRRTRIKRLFSEIPEARADAIDALKEAWSVDSPCFEVSEMATMDPQIVALMAMKRDSQREVINWLTKL